MFTALLACCEQIEILGLCYTIGWENWHVWYDRESTAPLFMVYYTDRTTKEIFTDTFPSGDVDYDTLYAYYQNLIAEPNVEKVDTNCICLEDGWWAMDIELFPLTPEQYTAAGDANKNGIIDAADATMVLCEYAAIQLLRSSSQFSQEQKTACDWDYGNTLTPADASAILTYYSYSMLD